LQPGVVTEAILTTGDAVKGRWHYALPHVGIPDGLGAFDNHDSTFTLLVNHSANSRGKTRLPIRRRAIRPSSQERMIRRLGKSTSTRVTRALPRIAWRRPD
jgi:hypothetical protein